MLRLCLNLLRNIFSRSHARKVKKMIIERIRAKKIKFLLNTQRLFSNISCTKSMEDPLINNQAPDFASFSDAHCSGEMTRSEDGSSSFMSCFANLCTNTETRTSTSDAEDEETMSAISPVRRSAEELSDSLVGFYYELVLMILGQETERPYLPGVESSCMEFKNHMMDLISGSGDPADLADLQEIVECFGGLTSPVFKEVLGHFYADLCLEAFSSSDNSTDKEDDEASSSNF